LIAAIAPRGLCGANIVTADRILLHLDAAAKAQQPEIMLHPMLRGKSLKYNHG
jgi:hypothetical protein